LEIEIKLSNCLALDQFAKFYITNTATVDSKVCFAQWAHTAKINSALGKHPVSRVTHRAILG